MPTFGSLFAGIGGIDLGLERAGWTGRWQVEWDDFCCHVLEHHWPDVSRYRDIRDVDWSAVEPVDLIAGGFPCQPFSTAGKRRGKSDERWLWPEFFRCVRELRPSLVLVENVAGFLQPHGGLGNVLGDLAEIGYDAEWDCIPAAAVGAPHRRDRFWLVAYPDGVRRGLDELRAERFSRELRRSRTARRTQHLAPARCEVVADSTITERRATQPHDLAKGRSQAAEPRERRRIGRPVNRGWPAEPDVGRVADGVPARVDRLRSLGNAVVPQVAEMIGRDLLTSFVERDVA